MNPHFEGDDNSDVPLRHYLERFCQGETLENLQPLTRWLGRFAAIRCSERSCEGIHALVTKVYKRAPAAGLAYVSIELRSSKMLSTVAKYPMAT